MDQIIRFIGLDLGSCCKYLYEVETTLGARPRGIRKGFDLDWIGIGPKRCEHFKSVAIESSFTALNLTACLRCQYC